MSALHRRQLLVGASGALSTVLAGCGSDSDGTDTAGTGRDDESTTATRTPAGTVSRTEARTPTGTESDTARVRVAQMSPDAPDVVTSLDGEVVPANLGIPFGRVGDYAEVPTGTRRLTVTELDERDTVLFDREVTLDPADYTFVATGEVTDDEPAFRVFGLVDDNSDPGANTARLRVVHVSTDTGPVDVTLEAGPVLFDSLAFTDSGYVTVEPGDYTVQVRSGTPTDDGELIDELDVSMEGGTVATVFAAGYRDLEFASDTAFDLTVVQDATS